MKRVWLAYILWLFFGFAGVHHFYLRRDRQAFVWWATLGGFCGLGWIRDFWRLPEYVKEANEEEEEEEEDGYITENHYWRFEEKAEEEGEGYRYLTENHHSRFEWRSGRPKISMCRFGGMFAMGYLFANLTTLAFPWDIKDDTLTFFFFEVARCMAAALGIHLVANIGRIRVSCDCFNVGTNVCLWSWNAMGLGKIPVPALCLLLTAFVSYFGPKWKPPKRRRKRMCRRMVTLFTGGTVYLMLIASFLYFNATVTGNDGREIPFRMAVSNFLASPDWARTKQFIRDVWQEVRVYVWRTVMNQILGISDPLLETDPYKILGVSKSASQQEITAKYRALVKKWHPDKERDPARMSEAHERFMKIQEAYETLSNKNSRKFQHSDL